MNTVGHQEEFSTLGHEVLDDDGVLFFGNIRKFKDHFVV